MAKQRIMLLVTNQTTSVRIAQHRERLAERFGRQVAEIKVLQVGASCEVPSALAEQYNVLLFADGSVASVAPLSTALARDWAERWFLPSTEAGRPHPLYQCKLKPRSGR